MLTSLLRTGGVDRRNKKKPETKRLNKPLVEVSSTKTVLSILSSKCESTGWTHPIFAAGVFPDPDGASAIENKFDGSLHDTKSSIYEPPVGELSHANALDRRRSREQPWLSAMMLNHDAISDAAISSQGMEIEDNFLSKSSNEEISSSCYIVWKRREKNTICCNHNCLPS